MFIHHIFIDDDVLKKNVLMFFFFYVTVNFRSKITSCLEPRCMRLTLKIISNLINNVSCLL